MQIAKTIDEMRSLRRQMPGDVGFVPTMGALHEGHLSLVRQARADNESVIASIFVNPTQFAPHEDLSRYPRPLDRDLGLLREERANVVFMPDANEIYPEGFATWVVVDDITKKLEGASRPGHFKGVATVVAKLFNIVQPQKAYFGRKDAQQLVVIRKMTRDLDMDIEIVPMPTVREADGLAMSSRNAYLSPEERKAAPIVRRALTMAEQMYRDGARDAEALRQAMEDAIAEVSLARLDYVSVADAETLEELKTIETGHSALVSLAVYFSSTRLIDNVALGEA